MNKPDLIEIAHRYGDVRRRGKEFVTHAPCHNDRHPSCRLNPEKQVWFCDPCARGGDVIAFVQLAENVDFINACRVLDIGSSTPIKRRRPRRAAALLAGWLNHQHLVVGARCREVSRQIALADALNDTESSNSFRREFQILSDLHEDLAHPEHAADLWAVRSSIEAITADVEPEPLPDFPVLTETYRAYLRSIVEC
jgi:hypothetical protein